MSPEQSRGWEDLDGRADIYSLACIVFRMLAGEPPPSIRVVRPDVTERVERAVMRALEKNRKDRPGSGEEFRKDLSD